MDVLQTLKSERDRLAKDLSKVNAAIKALGGSTGGASTRPTLSVAARARIAAAQRARWAKVRGEKQNVVRMRKTKRKTLSLAARKKIAAAQRARWAKVKAAKKAGK